MNDKLVVFYFDGIRSAVAHTIAIEPAFFDIINQNGFPADTFRIGAPITVQRASLHKNERPASGTIVNGKPLYVEDIGFQLHFNSS